MFVYNEFNFWKRDSYAARLSFHTEFSGDSTTPVRSQIERAIALHMDSLCVTDHHDYDVDSPIDFTLDPEIYFNTMCQLREEYKEQIDLRIGIELGLQPHLKQYYDQLLKRYDFDYVIGSTHFINRKDAAYPEFFEGRREEEAYLQYFEATLDNVKLKDAYDAAGHIDYIVRYGPNKAAYYNYHAYQDIIDEILKTVIEMGKGIELNTAGYRKGIGQSNPFGRYYQTLPGTGRRDYYGGIGCPHTRRFRCRFSDRKRASETMRIFLLYRIQQKKTGIKTTVIHLRQHGLEN